jgi:hypothetical protein
MAYMNAERKKIIAANLKPVLKKYGMKGTLRVRNHIAIVLTLQSGPINFLNRDQINPYWFHEHFEGVAKQFLTEAFAALKSAGYYNNSDASIDYFDVSYYYDISIGKYNKPYVYTGEPVREVA